MLQFKTHNVERLNVHVEQGGSFVTFDPRRVDITIPNMERTKLTMFFDLCSRDEAATLLLYHEVPKRYTWFAAQKKWKKRQRGGAKMIGRMIVCCSSDRERYHPRMLLCYCREPKSIADVRTVDGTVYATLYKACVASGYLEDDSKYHNCLTEAAGFQMPYQLRQLFATVLVYEQPGNIVAL